MFACLLRVSRNGFVGFEVQIALDAKAELAANRAKFGDRDIAEFRLAHS